MFQEEPKADEQSDDCESLFDEQHHLPHPKPQRRIFLAQGITSHCLTTIIVSLLWIGLPYFYNSASHILLGSNAADHNSTILAGFDYFNCGNSTESAKAMGCTYDILDNHWVPTQCIDEQAIEEYQSDGSWHGYADSEHKHMLSLAEMGERPVYWTSKRDHIVHCASLWIKQFNAFIEGRDQFDSLIVDSMHTKHCAKYLIDRTDEGEDFRKEPIQVEVGFAGCHIRRTR